MEEEGEQEDFLASLGLYTDTPHTSDTTLRYPETQPGNFHCTVPENILSEERVFAQPYHHVFSPLAHVGVAVVGLVGPVSVFLSYLGQPTQRDGRVPRGYQLLLGDNALLGIFSLVCHCSGMGCGQEGWDLADT